MSITDESILGSVADLEAEIRNEIHRRMTEFAHKVDAEIPKIGIVERKSSLRDEIERIGKAGHTVKIFYPDKNMEWDIYIDGDSWDTSGTPVKALRNFKT